MIDRQRNIDSCDGIDLARRSILAILAIRSSLSSINIDTPSQTSQIIDLRYIDTASMSEIDDLRCLSMDRSKGRQLYYHLKPFGGDHSAAAR